MNEMSMKGFSKVAQPRPYDTSFLVSMFKAGAHEAAVSFGMKDPEAGKFAGILSKMAAIRNDDDEDEEESFWSRNKHWLLPTLIGTGAFLLGSEAGRWERKDRGHFTNGMRHVGKSLRGLFGLNNDAVTSSATTATGYKSKLSPENGKNDSGDDSGRQSDA